MSTLLDINNIETSFHTEDKIIKIIDGVSIQVKKGEIVGLVGESGSGKSVTMLSAIQLIANSGRVTAGKVELDEDGKNILEYDRYSKEMREIRGGRIGMIFQEPMTSLNPVMPIGKQIQETIIEHCGLSPAEAKVRAIEMMKLVNIPDAEERYGNYAQQFSGGMRQRIMIAMVLAAEPDILIADEATTALDVTTQAQLLEMIRDLSKKTGVAVVVVTHNLGIVARYAERIYVMYSGNVVETADTLTIFKNPQHPYTRGLLRAIPRLTDAEDRVLTPIDGLPPTPQARPAYCPFFERCRYAVPECAKKAKPQLVEIEPDHFIACHLDADIKRRKAEEIANELQKARPVKNISDELCLNVSGLKKSFNIYKGIMQRKVGSFNAIEDISFTLRKGETLGIVGESGCGKTTLARCILRMYQPNEGKIELYGNDIAGLSKKELTPYRSMMSLVFQDPFSSLNPRMTAGELVGEPLKIQKLTSSHNEYEKRVDELFRLVGIHPSQKDRFPHEFSGGQRQRLGVARALALNPKMMILDEPISALDVSIQAQVINLLEELQAEMGLSYLFIAHDLAVVKHISDRVLVMYLGRVMEIAETSELYDNPLHPYTKALLSSVPLVDPEHEKGREYIPMKGEVPSVMNRPKGCPFSDRCDYANEHCHKEKPSIKDVGKGHFVACFRY